MIVNYKPWWSGGVRQKIELKSALRPYKNTEGGAVEQAQAQADANADAIGALAALLVERGHISLEGAAEACGVRGSMDIISEG